MPPDSLGPREALVGTLADWQPGMQVEMLDFDALTHELINPDHPGLRAILREVHAVPRNDWTAWHNNGTHHQFSARLREAAMDQTSRFVFDVLCRRAFANWPWMQSDHYRYPLRTVLHDATRVVSSDPRVTGELAIALQTGAFELDLSVSETERGLCELTKLFAPAMVDKMHSVRPEAPVVPFCRLAVRHRSAACFAAIERMLENLATIPPGAGAWPFYGLRASEDVAAVAGLDRQTVPLLRVYDKEAARRFAARETAASIAGRALKPVLESLFEGQDLSGKCRGPNGYGHHPAIVALLRHSPEVLGQALIALVSLTDLQPTLAPKGWRELVRGNGRFDLNAKGDSYMANCFNKIAELSLRRRVTLSDQQVAALLNGLTKLPGLRCRGMLNLALKTAAAHPGGAAEARLRETVASETKREPLPEGWRAAIERQIDRAPQVLAPPDIFEGGTAAHITLSAHFRALFDVRLHDARHRAFLKSVPETVAAHLDEQQLENLQRSIRESDDARRTEDERRNHNFILTLGAHIRSLSDVRLRDPRYWAHLKQVPDPTRAHFKEQEIENLKRLFSESNVSSESNVTGPTEDDRHKKLAEWLRIKSRISGPPGDTLVRCCFAIAKQLTAVSAFVAGHPEVACQLENLAADIETKSGPGAKWLRQAKNAAADLPPEETLALLRVLIEATVPDRQADLHNDHNLRTLIYLASAWDPAESGPLLTDFALRRCYQTDPGFGIRNEKLGNACLWALIHMPDGRGVPFLGRLLAGVKYPKIRKRIDAALNEAAAAAGMTRGTLDELTVPTHGLNRHGRLSRPVGEGKAAITVGTEAGLAWISPEGKPLNAPTAALKADAAAIKTVKQTVKEIDADLGVQRRRLQRLYLDDRSWRFADWCERYRDHPLISDMVGRLIWWVETDGDRRSARPVNDVLEDAAGAPVAADRATIRLWHPIEDTPDSVRTWRDRLEAQSVTQPFAQTWREIYRLTDAELATGTYSNRWAAHVLKQHQAMTLARINGWTVTHRMSVDAPNDAPWHLMIPAHGLVADYWVEGDGTDMLESSAFVYVATDRLTFHRLVDPTGKDSARGPARAEPAPLETLPPVVLSEVMRHCDLFTAVASIASDPAWRDRGANAAHPSQWRHDAEVYWARASFADLSGSGKIRRELLERLVPRLAFADRCGFDDQALTVKGRLHQYRIHLGSAAVQIAETRQHVCIVPKVAPRETIQLPFAGDPTLSLILSKAALLVRDDRITDPVILRQI